MITRFYLATIVLASTSSWAADIPCSPVEKYVVIVDGMLNDWKDVKAFNVDHPIRASKNWNDAADSSLSIMCNYTKTKLYLAIDVQDEMLTRTARGTKDDHLLLKFGKRRLRIYPSDLKKHKRRVLWGKKKAKGIKVAEAMQPKGWSVELEIAIKAIPGHRSGQGAISVDISHVDVDWRGKVDSRVSTGKSRLVIAQVVADLKGFLNDIGVNEKAIRRRYIADVVGDRGVEHILLVKKIIGIVGSGLPQGGYFYFNLPIAKAEDLLFLKLLDLNGDGQKEIVVRYLQRASSGRREILAVYRFTQTNKFTRPFAHEVLKGRGNAYIKNQVQFKRRKKGIDIVIAKPYANGFTQDNFRENPATDMHGILLPWSEKQKEVFRFEGDEYSEQ